jgi:hypothetical protein
MHQRFAKDTHYEVIDMQILWPTSNLPDGVNILTSGGLKAEQQSVSSPDEQVDSETYDSQKGT